MTDKKENILEAALQLFANEGYNATSTSTIAKQAKVSEGLIFRHFENKKGLLDAIMQEAENRLQVMFTSILFEEDPQEVIDKTIKLPFSIKESEYDFWKLQFQLKWQTAYYNPNKMKPVSEKIFWAFSQLGYENPEYETQLLNQLLDALAAGLLRNEIKDKTTYQSFLLSKYQR
ncbi:MAG: TetR/AcrR family transcriptional regulator [Spirosomataceae bacterium]